MTEIGHNHLLVDAQKKKYIGFNVNNSIAIVFYIIVLEE